MGGVVPPGAGGGGGRRERCVWLGPCSCEGRRVSKARSGQLGTEHCGAGIVTKEPPICIQPVGCGPPSSAPDLSIDQMGEEQSASPLMRFCLGKAGVEWECLLGQGFAALPVAH
jgi:hypothetical protein